MELHTGQGVERDASPLQKLSQIGGKRSRAGCNLTTLGVSPECCATTTVKSCSLFRYLYFSPTNVEKENPRPATRRDVVKRLGPLGAVQRRWDAWGWACPRVTV